MYNASPNLSLSPSILSYADENLMIAICPRYSDTFCGNIQKH